VNLPLNFHEVAYDEWQRRQPSVVQTGRLQVEHQRRERMLFLALKRSRRAQPVTDQPGWLAKLTDRVLNALGRKTTALNRDRASDGELVL
jgi:hypothetical protein